MPNTVAYAALLIWPLATLAIFAYMRPAHAVVWSLLAGYLILPVKTSFDFPGVPALDKTSIANLSTFTGAVMFAGIRSVKLPREWWLKMLMAAYLVSPMLTSLGNQDSLSFGGIILPRLTPYDGFSASAYKAIDLMPLLLGYNLLRNASAQGQFLKALAIAALCYSLLMLVEIRLSPQLHTWIYGFFPHSFGQQMRSDGFRPVVFLGHGLVVAIFTAMAITATAHLARQRVPLFGISSWVCLAYLLTVLVLCKSLGALILAIAAVMIVIFTRRTAIQIVCAVSALIVVIYPALRGGDLVPVQMVNNYVAEFSEERAGSFQTRIDNEDQLLARANQRPWFGWGGYGRNRIFDEETGEDLSITDGSWIVIIGTNGWFGYLATFGLLCTNLLYGMIKKQNPSPRRDAISLILVINLLDCLPNSSVTPLTWLMTGAIVPVTLVHIQSRKTSLSPVPV